MAIKGSNISENHNQLFDDLKPLSDLEFAAYLINLDDIRKEEYPAVNKNYIEMRKEAIRIFEKALAKFIETTQKLEDSLNKDE
jgi:hypothetical protein